MLLMTESSSCSRGGGDDELRACILTGGHLHDTAEKNFSSVTEFGSICLQRRLLLR
jgi:hypothetical protein